VEIMDFLLFLLYTVAIAYLSVVLPGFIWGAGYEPTPKKVVKEFVELLNALGMDGKTVYEVGGGFGRVAFCVLSKTRCNVVFIEPDPFKVWWATKRAKKKGFSRRFFALRKSALDVNYSGADIVYCFLTPWLMNKLKSVFETQLKEGALVVSYRHKLKGWKPVLETSGGLRVYKK